MVVTAPQIAICSRFHAGRPSDLSGVQNGGRIGGRTGEPNGRVLPINQMPTLGPYVSQLVSVQGGAAAKCWHRLGSMCWGRWRALSLGVIDGGRGVPCPVVDLDEQA